MILRQTLIGPCSQVDGKEFELIAKTIMRKKDFKTSNKKLSFEENQPKRILRLAKSFKRKYD